MTKPRTTEPRMAEPRKTQPQMDSTPNGPNPEWTQQASTCLDDSSNAPSGSGFTESLSWEYIYIFDIYLDFLFLCQRYRGNDSVTH